MVLYPREAFYHIQKTLTSFSAGDLPGPRWGAYDPYQDSVLLLLLPAHSTPSRRLRHLELDALFRAPVSPNHGEANEQTV